MAIKITVDHNKIAKFCDKHHIIKFAFFGSVLGEKFSSDSDVDVLVYFEPSHIPGLLGMAKMEMELSEILGRKADLRTPNDLSHLFREKVIHNSEVEYAA
jgi:predicted nucleotidyltransferase